jgi:hypothetical protein
LSASLERTLVVELWRFDVARLLARGSGTAALRRAGREAAGLVRRSAGAHAGISRSYAGAYVYVAAADADAIGVDAEHVRPLPRAGAGLSRLLSAPERAWITTLPDGEQLRTAHELWTLKEAFGKAQGIGLHVVPWALDFSSTLRGARGSPASHPHPVPLPEGEGTVHTTIRRKGPLSLRERDRVRVTSDRIIFATFTDDDGRTVGAIAARPMHPCQHHLVIRRHDVLAR